jgi:salicylate hydroxylase
LASPRHVIVAGAGIAGLTAALSLARNGLRVTVLEQAARLEEAGAGIQLSPNATRVLIDFGLYDLLFPLVIAPHAVRVMNGGSGREIVRIPLAECDPLYGAPYWTLHRADLQAALLATVKTTIDIELKLGTRVDDFAAHTKGVTVQGNRGRQIFDERGIALIGADGVWSNVATKLDRSNKPRFAHRTAWRALVPAASVAAEFRTTFVHLWLGQDAHLVHYPVKGGRLINIVAVVNDEWNNEGWSASGEPDEILRHFARFSWADKARELIASPEQWTKWALYERSGNFEGADGPVTLIGDAAHPMLPFLAQGAGMAIEDAAVLGAMLGKYIDDPAAGLRAYEAARRHRTARAQKASAKQADIYGKTGPEAFARNLVMKVVGGERLRRRYDWLYTWRPPEGSATAQYQMPPE